MRGKLPPLNALRSFEAVARNLSFTKAAAELFVTEPAVSRAIKSLEEHFGITLFRRRPQGLELTAEGKLLMPAVSTGLDEMAGAASYLYGKRPRPSLTILAAPYLALRWLVPRMREFTAAHPEMDITLVSSVDTDEILSTSFDVALWWDAGDWSGYHREVITKRHFVPMCSQALIDEHPGITQSPPQLNEVPLLHERDYQYWQDWLSLAGWEQDTPQRSIVFSNYETLLGATLEGVGLGLILEQTDMDTPFEHAFARPLWPGYQGRNQLQHVLRRCNDCQPER